MTRAAERLRAAGFKVPAVSVGSTPTALHARSLDGVTEMRPGVYTLFDLAQVALGSCTIDDIAVSVLTTVIGHNPRVRRMLVDAGALALSKDVSGNKGERKVGFGLVCAADDGRSIDGLIVADVNQEHGLIAGEGINDIGTGYPVGTRLRILPNHACLTAASYDRYYVVRGSDPRVVAVWPKAFGWSLPGSADS